MDLLPLRGMLINVSTKGLFAKKIKKNIFTPLILLNNIKKQKRIIVYQNLAIQLLRV